MEGRRGGRKIRRGNSGMETQGGIMKGKILREDKLRRENTQGGKIKKGKYSGRKIWKGKYSWRRGGGRQCHR